MELRFLKRDGTLTFEDLIKPKNFDVFVEAVKSILCIESKARSLNGAFQFEKPFLAPKLGQCMKKWAFIKKGAAIRNGNNQAREESENFIRLYEREYTDSISSLAAQTIQERRYNKPELLPVTEDLKKLVQYQEAQMKMLTQEVR